MFQQGIVAESVVTPASLTVTQFDDLLTFYADEYLPAQAPSTQYQKRRLFLRFQRDFGHLPLAALTPDLFRAWRNRLRARLKPSTTRYYMEVMSGVLTVGVEQGWLPSHPLKSVRKPPIAAHRARFLDTDERERLLAACQRSRCPMLYPLVLLAVTTGMRKTEMLTLRWRDVDLERGLVSLVHTKNGTHRAVPVPEVTCQVLRLWKEQDTRALVFPSKTGLHPADVSRAWAVAMARADLEDFRFHDLRHTCASYLAMSGCSLREIAEVLGHKTLEMSMRYAHLAASHTSALVERMAQQFLMPPPRQN